MIKIPSHLYPYIISKNENICKAFCRIAINKVYKILLVVDKGENLVGVLSDYDISSTGKLRKAISEDPDITAGDVCTRNFTHLTTKQDKYLYGTRIFAEKTLNEIPIVDSEGIPVEIFGRFQAFFLQFIRENKHLRPHYAKAIGAAGELAIRKGYNRISVIEFGVASGSGLRLAEIYAEEVSHLTGVSIDVYGFDSGVGLKPSKRDYRDVTQAFFEGAFETDIPRLEALLKRARLVVGDICNTVKDFLCDDIAPIGAMLIDVDLYHPTVAILDMLLEDDKYFLPEVFMYFDDIANNWEFQGESLGIKEFNEKSKKAKISPELTLCSHQWYRPPTIYSNGLNTYHNNCGMERLKVCSRFSHPKFERESIAFQDTFIF